MHLVYNYKKKNVEENITNGCKTGISKYWGMGFVKFGTKDSAAVKDTVNTTKAGFMLTPRQNLPTGKPLISIMMKQLLLKS